MYKKHRTFEEVPDNTVIWQYMSLSKFICLLKEKKLYLNRIDNYSDTKECSLTAIDKKLFRYNIDVEAYWEKERKRHFISCWVESNYELALMWDTYGKEGVAIKTTIEDLKKSLSADKDHNVYISRIKYLDEQLDSSQKSDTPLNVLRIPMSKRKYYEQEKEIRLLFSTDEERLMNKTGLSFPIFIEDLIKEVKVYPNAPDYFLNIVNQELASNGIQINAMKSEI